MRRMMTEKEIATVESLRKDGITSLKDAQGNPRFVEGDITMNTIEGVTQTYGKWSLSGTHLMIVLNFTIENGKTFTGDTQFAKIPLPQYILNKISVLFDNVFVDFKSFNGRADDWSVQNLNFSLRKATNGLSIYKNGDVTLNATRRFRIQFDLLIDSD